MKNSQTAPAATAAQPLDAQTTTAPYGSHIDDSDFFVNPPIRTNLTKETWEAWYRSQPELPTHFAGHLLPEDVRESFVGYPGAYVDSAKPDPVDSNKAQSYFQGCTDEEFGRDNDTQDPIVTLAACNARLQFTYAHELAALVKLGAHVQARAVCAPHRKLGPDTSVLLTVKDGLVGSEVGADGELTFTFWDKRYPTVTLGSLTLYKFQEMA